MKLSILLPSIRPFLLENLFNGILHSCNGQEFELVIVTPYNIPESLENDSRIKVIKDHGSISRALQIGLINSTGDYITVLSDDCIMTSNGYKEAVEKFETMSPKGNRMLVLAFREGSIGEFVHNGEYHFFQAWFHPDLRVGGFPKNTPMALQFILDKETLINIGGWDCLNYQCGNWGGHDLTGRLMNKGIIFEIMPGHICKTIWAPGIEGAFGDHRPVWESAEHGMPVFKEMWKEPNNRIKIDLDNWKQAPAVWKLRFKD